MFTRAEDEAYYEKANNEWLLDKIKRERESIRFNKRMIAESQYDIEICEGVLFRRNQNVHE